MSLNSNEREAFVKLAEAIKSLSCLVDSNNTSWVEERLAQVHKEASEAIILVNTPPITWAGTREVTPGFNDN